MQPEEKQESFQPAIDTPVDQIDYLAYEGGAALGLAYPGAMQALRDAYTKHGAKEQKEAVNAEPFRWPLKGVSGTSTGAIFAFITALGYSPKEISDIGIRDGIFGKLFQEEMKPGYHLGIATDPNSDPKVTKPGWYGDTDIHADPDGTNINDLFDACGPEIADIQTQSVGILEFLKLLGKSNFIDWFRPLIDNSNVPEIDKAFYETIGSFLGLPGDASSIQNAFLKFYGGIFFDALISQSKTSPVEDFARNLNKAAEEKLEKAFPIADFRIGNQSGTGPRFWGILLTFPMAVLLILFWPLVLDLFAPNRFKKGNSKDFVSQVKPSRSRAEKLRPRDHHVARWLTDNDKKDREGNRGRSDGRYARKLLWIIWGHNIISDASLRKQGIKILRLGTRLLRQLLFNRQDNSEEKLRRLLSSLESELIGFVCQFVFSPFTQTLWQSVMEDGGMFPATQMREIHQLVVFNKCYVAKTGPGDEDWVLRPRHKTLIESFDDLLESREGKELGLASLDEFQKAQKDEKKKYRIDLERQRASLGEGKLWAELKEQYLIVHQKISELKSVRSGYYINLSLLEFKDQERENELKKKIADLDNKIEEQEKLLKSKKDASDSIEEDYIPQSVQLNIIENKLTFEKLYEMTGIDLVITLANITNTVPGYFRKSFTPDFPVIEAVRMAGAFPILFKPTAVCYKPSKSEVGYGSAKDPYQYLDNRTVGIDPEMLSDMGYDMPMGYSRRDWFYDVNYKGYFIDAGTFNNLPINAFNGTQTDDVGNTSHDEYLTVQEKLCEPLNDKIIGFELTNDDLSKVSSPDRMFRPPYAMFKGGYKKRVGFGTRLNNQYRSFGGLFGGVIKAFFAMGGKLRQRTTGHQKAVLPVISGNLGMFDMVPDHKATLDVFTINHQRIYRALTGRELTDNHLNTTTQEFFGVSYDTVKSGNQKEVRKVRRAWNKARKVRAAWLGLPKFF